MLSYFPATIQGKEELTVNLKKFSAILKISPVKAVKNDFSNMKIIRRLLNFLFTKRMKHGEIGTHQDLQKKYNLYTENKPQIILNKKEVPIDLQDLISMAEKWGIGDDIIRSDFEDKASEFEKNELRQKLDGRHIRLDEWLDSFNDGKEMPESAAAFMYMTLAFEEMGLYEPIKEKE